MKKSMNKTLQPRKLVLRREAIASLTPPQLMKVMGGSEEDGDSQFGTCNTRPPQEL
jgi:hypothetical protein